MSMVRCESCLGRKVVKGLGNIERKCNVCTGLGFKECDDLANANAENISVKKCAMQSTNTDESPILLQGSGLLVNDSMLGDVCNKNNDSLSPLEQKKIDQSTRMKEAWAKRKAKANQG